MKRGTIIGIMGFSLLLLLIVAAGCGPNLQPKVDELENQVASLEGDKTSLQSQVNSLQTDKTSLETDKATLETDKTNLQSQVDSLEGEKSDLEEVNQLLTDLTAPPPSSLPADWLFVMFGMATPFEGIGVDLGEGDLAGIQANYDAFQVKYTETAALAPAEWLDRFPQAPVDALGAAIAALPDALATGDPDTIGAAFGQVGAGMGGVGQVCESCHLRSLVNTHLATLWPDFNSVMVTDPVTNESVVWIDYMFRMSGSFSAIGNDLQQEQLTEARAAFDDFSARFKALDSNGCTACHATPRYYFVDDSVDALVDLLGAAVNADPPDATAIEELSGGIGFGSCMGCHLVHFPAAKTIDRWEWEEFADLWE